MARARLSINIPRRPTTACGRVALGRALQSGAHGTVHEATALDTGARLAVKVAHWHGDGEHVRRLASEARLLAQLPAHAHIVATFPTKYPASQSSSRAFYLPMERCDTDLLELLLSTKVPRLHVLHLALQLTAALHHCHSNGVYHLDVKPENVLVDIKNRTLKLADFGMAQSLDAAAAAALTGQHGSASYAAPEVWDVDAQPASGVSAAAADVWSLGAVLFTMLLRRRCWSDVSPAAHDKDFAFYRKHSTFLLYAGEHGVIDAPLMALLRSMLSLDAAKRPALLYVARVLTAMYNRELAAVQRAAATAQRAAAPPAAPVHTTTTTAVSAPALPGAPSGSASPAHAGAGAGAHADDDDMLSTFVARKSCTSVSSPMSYGSVSPTPDTHDADVVMVAAA